MCVCYYEILKIGPRLLLLRGRLLLLSLPWEYLTTGTRTWLA